MKKRTIALALVLSLLLTGCASMLNQSYVSVTPHDKLPAAEVDSSAIRVEDYPELVSAILYLVSQGEEEGVIRLHNYKRDVAQDVTAACDEVSREDPLGAYAVDGIKHSVKRIVSYYEATVSISYRRTPEQIAAVVPVTGSGAIRNELQAALTDFAPGLALRVNYFSEDEASIRALVKTAYYDAPASAFGLPQAEVALYPDSGAQRIVEVVLTYPGPREDLQKQSAELRSAAEALALPLAKGAAGDRLLRQLYEALRTACPETGGATPYGALVEGGANSEGMALAYRLLCDTVGIECTVAEGEDADGTPRYWTIVAAEDGHRHVDPSRADGLLLTDEALAELGVTWIREDYPPCGPAEAEAK